MAYGRALPPVEGITTSSPDGQKVLGTQAVPPQDPAANAATGPEDGWEEFPDASQEALGTAPEDIPSEWAGGGPPPVLEDIPFEWAEGGPPPSWFMEGPWPRETPDSHHWA